MTEYFQWQRVNNGFHDTFEQDLNRVRFAKYKIGIYSAAGGAFAAAVVNPNFTKRRSWYLRKFNIGFFALIGAAWGKKCTSEATFSLMMKMHDYLPLEVKRTLESKDYRHMATFDYKNPNRQLFDQKTRKSLS